MSDEDMQGRSEKAMKKRLHLEMSQMYEQTWGWLEWKASEAKRVQNIKALSWEHNWGKMLDLSEGEQGRKRNQRGRQNQIMNDPVGNGQQFKYYLETDGDQWRVWSSGVACSDLGFEGITLTTL